MFLAARRPRLDLRANLQTIRRENVALFTIRVLKQCDNARCGGVVLNLDYIRYDAPLTTLEINLAILLLMPTTDVARS